MRANVSVVLNGLGSRVSENDSDPEWTPPVKISDDKTPRPHSVDGSPIVGFGTRAGPEMFFVCVEYAAVSETDFEILRLWDVWVGLRVFVVAAEADFKCSPRHHRSVE